MELNDSLGKITSLLTIDTTTAAPHGGTTNVLTIVGTGGLVLPVGTTGQQPTQTAGLLRYNSSISALEFSNGSAWTTLAAGTGTVTGNLTFTGVSARILGDFSNATQSNRVMFQSSTTNGNTNVECIPNGTGNTASIIVTSSNDPLNASIGILQMNTGVDTRILSGLRGTGTYLPMTFYTGGVERVRILTTGDVTATGTIAMGSAYTFRNKIINGCCRVQQRGTIALTGAAQIGPVDRFIAACTGTGVSGTINANTGVGTSLTSGNGIWLQSFSLTSGSPLIGTRMESKDTIQLNGKTVTFSCKLYHDFGSNTNFAASLYKANSVDNFGALTSIGAFATVSCISGGYTVISGSLTLASTDASNGLYIQIGLSAAQTITNKNIIVGDLQLEEGSIATPMEIRPYEVELAMCQRYYEVGNLQVYRGYQAATSGQAFFYASYKVSKRVIPTNITITSSSFSGGSTPATYNYGLDGHEVAYTITAANSYMIISWTSLAEL